MKNDKLLQEIEAIEQKLKSDPNSPELWFQLFSRISEDKNLYGHPKRIENILRYIQNNPRDELCITPYVQVDPKISPEGYEKIKDIWDKLLKENSGDAKIVRGAANFYCADDRELAKKVLRNFLDKDPTQAKVWLDLGRYTLDAKERLEYLNEAGKHGSKNSNLPVWFLMAAIEAQEYDMAEAIANKLLHSLKKVRKVYGNKLDWKEKGSERREKALQETSDRESAYALIEAIGIYNYYKHYTYTALGHIALKNNDIDSAIKHLIESGNVVSESRLSSYGPSFSLAKELCKKEEWSSVEQYLELCSQFWDDERLSKWIAMVKSHQVPDFVTHSKG